MLRRLLFTAVIAANFAIPAMAQGDDDDGPGRGVARISLINGDVSVRRGDSGDVIAAAINSPLVVQDRLLTGPVSRAEVQFDWANMIRLSREAEIRLAELEHKRYIVQVARGTVTFRVLRDHDADVELSTPSVSVRPVKKGEYRITVLDDGTSEITVRSGEAEIYTPKGSERLKSGRTMLARGTAAEPEFRVAAELQEDDWDRWNERRDKDLSRSSSYSYVSRDIYGADDLDDHGHWVSAPNYGWVWAPRVAAGWAPYRHGRWSWIDYYGWSWVSYDPWGWAPYHYGRWFYNAPYGWCWWPGSVNTRHYWRPGLVAFFGFGNVRVGLGFGNIGWVPLAPFERYRPWYGRNYYNGYRNNTYVNNNVRIVNNVNITNVFRNARIGQAVTVVDHDGFRGGRSGGAYRGRDGDFSRVNAFEGRLPVTPGRESLRLADRDPAVRVASTRDEGRFFSRRAPATVDRVPFEDQRRGMEQVTRRTFGDDTTPRRDAESSAGGWRRVGEAGRGGQRTGSTSPVGGMERSFDGATGRGADDNGWRRFGSPRIDSSGSGGGTVTGRDSGGRFGQPAATPDARESRGSDRQSDWRGFNGRSERAAEPPATITGSGRGAAERNSDTGNWRRDISPRSEQQQPRTEQPRYEPPTRSDRQEAPRMERRSDGGGGRGSGDSVRISPSIVRERPSAGGGERSAPSMSRGSDSGGGRFGGGGDGGRGGGGAARSSDSGGGGGAVRGGGGGGRGR